MLYNKYPANYFKGQPILISSFSPSTALETIDRLSDTLDFTDFASRIIHPLVRTLDSSPDLRNVAMDTLSSLVLQLGKKYQIFIPMVNKVLSKHRISHQKYDTLVLKIVKVGQNFRIKCDMIMVHCGQNRHFTEFSYSYCH